MKRIIPIVALIFTSSAWGCKKCGPTSPGYQCVDFVSEQTGLDCRFVHLPDGSLRSDCTPIMSRNCARFDCI